MASVGPLDETEQDDYELAFLLFKESLFSSREGKKRKRPSEGMFMYLCSVDILILGKICSHVRILI